MDRSCHGLSSTELCVRTPVGLCAVSAGFRMDTRLKGSSQAKPDYYGLRQGCCALEVYDDAPKGRSRCCRGLRDEGPFENWKNDMKLIGSKFYPDLLKL